MNELMRNPLCEIFMRAVDPVADGIPDYPKLIKNPQDFTTIKRKLEAGFYTDIRLWYRDMMLVFTNCIAYNSLHHVYGKIAQYMSMVFKKKVRGLVPMGKNEWDARVQKLYNKIHKLSTNVPLDTPSLRNVKHEDMKNEVNISTLSLALSSLNSKMELFQIGQILNLYGVNIEGQKEYATVQLSHLPMEALVALDKYSRERFYALRLKYPD